MSKTDAIREAVAEVLREHGTAHLLPDDEFDCCVEKVVGLFTHVGWFQPNRADRRMWDHPEWEPTDEWKQPVLPLFTLAGGR